MSDELIRKLTAALSEDMESEERIVYILVQTRKLLERGGFGRKTWIPVWFICDWVVHAELVRSQWATELLKRVESVVAARHS